MFNAEIHARITGVSGSQAELIRRYLAAGEADMRSGGASRRDSAHAASIYDVTAARSYDGWAAANCIGPEIAFGLMYPFLSGGQRIADFGVGTGLSAVPFKRVASQKNWLRVEKAQRCGRLAMKRRRFQRDDATHEPNGHILLLPLSLDHDARQPGRNSIGAPLFGSMRGTAVECGPPLGRGAELLIRHPRYQHRAVISNNPGKEEKIGQAEIIPLVTPDFRRRRQPFPRLR